MVDLVTPAERRINRMILEAGGMKGKAETPVSRKTLTEKREQGRSTGKANKKLNVEERNRRIVEQRLAGVPAAHLAAQYLVSTATVRRIVLQARKEGALPAMLAGVELGRAV